MCELGATHMKTDQTATKYKRYDTTFKHSAVEHWMLSGKSARIIAGQLGINEQRLALPRFGGRESCECVSGRIPVLLAKI